MLVIGATSAIAHAVARRYAARGARVFLVARNATLLATHGADLTTRGAGAVGTRVLDALDVAAHGAALDAAFTAFGGLDVALIAHGVLPDQAACERSVAELLDAFDVNARSTVALMSGLAQRFERQGSGVLAVISSPAADRGRASNFVYGASKAAVSVFAAGLRQRLYGRGVRVLTIVPGFVDTPMTASFKKGLLWASPEKVAADIDAALQRGFGVVYTPWFWRWIMLLIRCIPERVYVRMKL
ncbi:MAG: SDR family oxidoreductase [Proteobacteria bacterium]|nr:SDR family oxidoreductase [Burkholderiales bacterium]